MERMTEGTVCAVAPNGHFTRFRFTPGATTAARRARPVPAYDTVINKARYSGFAGTNLDTTLRAYRINNLLMVGVNTNVCVESTLRDAYHREYFAIMVADATFQSGPAAMMDATIFNVEKFFGWVSTVDEICRALPPRQTYLR
jgi:ureidoacrylate peracid hydrolase